MNKIAALAVILLFCVSCTKTVSPPSTFSKHGVSFSVPAGWKVTDEESFGEGIYYLSVEKAGFDSSGLITILWIPGEMDLTEGIESHREELRSNPMLKLSPPKFGEIHSCDFQGNQAETSTYTMSLLSLIHI